MIFRDKPKSRSSLLQTYSLYFVIVWTVIVGGFLLFGILQIQHVQHEMIKNEAFTNINKIQALRFWATTHGGVYVPITEETPPNPYLSHVKERDVKTPYGKALTLMNPSYMLRQVMEKYESLYGVRGHSTSLNPFRPETSPDEWERYALEEFEKGAKEISGILEIDGIPHYRYMSPMITKRGCLKCHGHQGYKVGDVRGGVSVSVPMTPYLIHQRQQTIFVAVSLVLLWLLGFAGLVWAKRGLEKSVRERDRAETELKKAREEAEAANQAKSNFLANVSHELRTPMNHIMGFIDIVLGSEIGATPKGFLKKARSSSNDLLTIINNIINFSQMDKDELSIEAVDFWLDDVCQDLVTSFSEQAGKKGLKLELNGDNSVPMGLVGDPQRLTQVLGNLTDNAIKFTQSGHVTIERKLSHQEEGRLTLQFTVRDTGIGISEDCMPELFDAFTQGDASSCRAYGGTGVGLAVSKKLVALMGGDIWVESTPGEGSSFYFTADFTLSQTAQPKMRATPSMETDSSDSLHQKKELVSDAEADQNEKRFLDVEAIRPLLVKLSELLEVDLMEAMAQLATIKPHFENTEQWDAFTTLEGHIEGFDTDSALGSLKSIVDLLEIDLI